MVATITSALIGGTAGHPSRRDVRGVYIVDMTVNLANVTGQTSGGGDTINLMNIPANTYIISAGLNVTAVGAGSGTVKVSDGTNDYTTAGATTSTGQQTVAAIVGRLMTAASKLSLITATAAVTGTVQVWAILADTSVVESISVI